MKSPFFTSKALLIISLLWSLVLLLIGSWWIYLLFNLENFLKNGERQKLVNMIAWEGGSFILILLFLSASLFFFYIKEQKKTKALQAFFSSLTHELKTPLASLRLQADVINEKIKQNNFDKLSIKSLDILGGRLIEDAIKLENQMDKILQLSRTERDGAMTLSSVRIVPYVKYLGKKHAPSLTISFDGTESINALVDEFAIELIFKNLFENSKIHGQTSHAQIAFQNHKDFIECYYSDNGVFTGDSKKIGSLFYKHNSKTGSGIGLYLSHKLAKQMGGDFKINIENNKKISFTLYLLPSTEEENA